MSFIPNTTPTPNWLYNGEMQKMNETELKVVLLVTRKTLGWFDPLTSERKSQDYISQSQFMKYTGQGNKAISRAIQSCVEHGWIIAKNRNGDVCNTPSKRARRKVWYQLGSVFTKKISGVERTPDLVSKGHSTKETTKRNKIHASSQKTRVTSKTMYRTEPDEIENRVDQDGEPVSPSHPKTGESMKLLLKWAEDRRGRKFTRPLVQFTAMKRMRMAKISPQAIRDRWQEMENDKYWEGKGFDFASVAASFDRKP